MNGANLNILLKMFNKSYYMMTQSVDVSLLLSFSIH